jgi:hypothetical protein
MLSASSVSSQRSKNLYDINLRTEQIIAKSIAELKRIEDAKESEEDEKVKIHFEESKPENDQNINWGKHKANNFNTDSSPSNLTKEFLSDLEGLEMKYKLKENWQEIDESLCIPFSAECSEIQSDAQQ